MGQETIHRALTSTLPALAPLSIPATWDEDTTLPSSPNRQDADASRKWRGVTLPARGQAED